ncbi:MAG: S46 family peptidase [Ignavibacteriae bacterium]|nr:S46 family peptidase [Ignavibacteriota bacterium]
MVVQRSVRLLLAAVVGVLCVSYAMADEGMWTFDNPPRKQLKELYGFEPTKEWLDHVRLSSVRFNDGGSGAFVSADGLVITNHHVARGQLQKMSSQQKNYVADGFYARTHAEELKSSDLELNVLVGMQDVTARVIAAMKPGMSTKEAVAARKAVMAAISKESKEKTGLRADVVSLYQGGEYWLYTYKQYTDVRLVMAPEEKIAFYGGDADNFTFPRYDLDMAFFRVYENDTPVKVEHFFRWNAAGAADGELVFVSGHPGSTNRLQTYAQTEYQRDVAYPMTLKTLKRRLAVLNAYAVRGAEQARQARGSIFGLENSLKAMTGEFGGLNDRETMAKKAAEEKDFRDRIMANPTWQAQYAWAWDSIGVALERQRAQANTRSFRSVRSRLLSFATTLVQYVEEIKKPNGERLAPYQDANLEGTRFRLFSPAPVYLDLDEEQCIDGLRESLEALGADEPFMKAVLRGKTPEALAKELVRGSKLADPAVRRQMLEGGEKAVRASEDPAIVLARIIEPMNRETRSWEEKNISGLLTRASEKIGEARFVVYGKTAYPDATFTLRLSYGTVKGYPMNGTVAPAKTTLFGLYDRAYSFDLKGAFDLPQRYLDRIGSLDLKTPVNFVSTCDIIGGNSGSPVINAKGEYVGLIFDGNIESLPGRFLYAEKANRAVSVHSAYIIHSLRKLYDAAPLADELEGK